MNKVLAVCFLLLSVAAWPAQAASWTVDPAQSKLFFLAHDLVDFTGTFKTWDAKIVFDPDHLDASSIVVEVDLVSADAKDAMRNSRMPGPDVFDVDKFPKAQFTSRRITKVADGSYEAVGTLNLHGIKKELKLPFTLTIDGTHAHAKGSVPVLRTDFRLGTELKEDQVEMKVTIGFDITATAAK